MRRVRLVPQRLGKIGRYYPWANDSFIVDAARPFTVEASTVGPREVCHYDWTFESSGDRFDPNPSVRTQSGDANQTITFNFPCSVTVTVLEMCGSCVEPARTATTNVIVMFVRREFRELPADDLKLLMDTMHIMWRVDGQTGRERYGGQYLNIDEMVLMHHVNAAQRDADHFHQGYGFLTQHAKITQLMEDSLRAIDLFVPSMPYWDPTIEATDVAMGRAASLWDNALWTNETFGSIRNTLALGASTVDLRSEGIRGEFDTDSQWRAWAIADGRWKEARVPVAAELFAQGAGPDGLFIPPHTNVASFPGVPLNGYGLLRAPWNANPSPYVTRFSGPGEDSNSMPTCQDHFDFLLSTETDDDSPRSEFAIAARQDEWMRDVSFQPHGRMHTALGGMNVLKRNPTLEDTFHSIGFNLEPKFSLVQKSMWRMRKIEYPPPGGCGANSTPPASCIGRCNDHSWSHAEIGRELAYNAAPLRYTNPETDLNDDDATAIGAAYCAEGAMEVVIKGDAFDSTGGHDPSFWPIHPAMERLFQWKWLTIGFSSYEWSLERYDQNEGACSVGHDVGVAFTHLGFTSNSTFLCDSANDTRPSSCDRDGDDAVKLPHGMTPCTVETCCEGHYPHSRLYARFPDSTFGPTNAEMLQRLNPLTRPDPLDRYVAYHHFRWTHCDDVGLNFRYDFLQRRSVRVRNETNREPN